VKIRYFLIAVSIGTAVAVTAPESVCQAQTQPNVVTLQRDIQRLKERLKSFDAMKARLEKLEKQLQEVQATQKEQDEKVADAARLCTVGGYLQFRYQFDNAPKGRREFTVRRARVNLRGRLDTGLSYWFQLQADAKEQGRGRGSKLQIRHVQIDMPVGTGRLRLGQAKIPWGYELEIPSTRLWAGERSLLMDRLFPNQRDIGVQYQWRVGGDGPVVDIGLFNGTGINASEDNSRKDPSLRLRVPFPRGSAALSWYDGRNGTGATAQKRQRFGVGMDLHWNHFSFLSEYVSGEDRGAHVACWYGQLGYRLPGRQGMLFVKPDWFDENTSLPDDSFHRTTLGYLRELNPQTTLLLAYELRRVEPGFSELSKWDGDAGYVHLQVKF